MHFENKDEIIWLTIEEEINTFYRFLNYTISKAADKNLEEKLKTLYMGVFEYNTLEKIKFWRNIRLIQNPDLRDKCSELIKQNEKNTGAKVLEFFTTAFSERRIDKDQIWGFLHLYRAMINGVLDGCLLLGEFNNSYIIATWKAYWTGLSKLLDGC